MTLFAALLKGRKNPQYFEADTCSIDKGTVTLNQANSLLPIAVFPFENLVAIIDVAAKAHLTEAQVRKKFGAQGQENDLHLDVLANQADHVADPKKTGDIREPYNPVFERAQGKSDSFSKAPASVPGASGIY
jgi:hypothetical protein